jgi:hypothetical protein
VTADGRERWTQRIAEAFDDLFQLTECRCDPAWTERDLHAPGCLEEYREDVRVLAAAANPPAPVTGRTAMSSNLGHGHVYPRPDGVKARCGGPGICSECSREAAQKAARGQR